MCRHVSCCLTVQSSHAITTAKAAKACQVCQHVWPWSFYMSVCYFCSRPSMPFDSHQKDTKQLRYSNRERPEKQVPCDAQSKINAAALTLLVILPILRIVHKFESKLRLFFLFFSFSFFFGRERGSKAEAQPQPVCPSVATHCVQREAASSRL